MAFRKLGPSQKSTRAWNFNCLASHLPTATPQTYPPTKNVTPPKNHQIRWKNQKVGGTN
jgi:hypothetical protein